MRRPVLPIERVGARHRSHPLLRASRRRSCSILVLRGLRDADARRPTASCRRRSSSRCRSLDAVLVVGLVLFFLRAHRESVREVLFGGGPRSSARCSSGSRSLPAVFLLVVARPRRDPAAFAPRPAQRRRQPARGHAAQPRGCADLRRRRDDRRRRARGGAARLHRCTASSSTSAARWWGVAIYSVLFGLGHLEQGYDAMIATGLLGASGGSLYHRRAAASSRRWSATRGSTSRSSSSTLAFAG